MATIGREAARAPLTSADINDGIVGAQDLQATLDLSSKAVTLPALSSLSVTGDLTVDTNTLYVDSTNNWVGMGTASPSQKLDVTDGAITAGGSGAVLIGRYSSSFPNPGDGYFSLSTNNSDGSNGGISFNTLAAGTLVERARIDHLGNLLVGTTDNNVTNNSTEAGAGINVGTAGVKGLLSSARWQGPPAVFNRMGSNGDIALFFKDGATAGVIGSELYNGDLFIGNSDTGIIFHDGNNAIQPFNVSTNDFSDAAINLGFSSTRFKDLYLSGGVYLGGTGAANNLDDYEEGTWTPTQGASWSFSQNLSSSSGTYVKIGNVVYVYAQLVLAGASTPTGIVIVSGLPFSSAIVAPGSYTSNDAGNSKAYGNLYATSTYLVMYDAVSGTTSNIWNLSAVYTV